MFQFLKHLNGLLLDCLRCQCQCLSCSGKHRAVHSTPEVSPLLSRGAGSPPWTCWTRSAHCSWGNRRPGLPPECTIGSWSAWWSTAPTGPSFPSCFPTVWTPACVGVWNCSSLCAWLCVSLQCLHEAQVVLSLQPAEVFLNGTTTNWCIYHSFQFYNTCKFIQCALCLINQAINQAATHHWSQHKPLGCFTYLFY